VTCGAHTAAYLACLAITAVAGPADAQPILTLTHEPPPRHLRMRPRAAAATPAPPARRPTPMPAAPPPLSPTDRGDNLAAVRDVREPVSFSLTIGYQVDNARPSGKASLDAPVRPGRDYNALRSYGFGELFLSTRGVALDSLSTYFALRLDAAQTGTTPSLDGAGSVRVAPPIVTWFERNVFEVRTGWAELKDFLPRRLGLRKLRLRAGSQYIYGPWVMHLDGALLAYEGDTITASAYAGGRHSDYSRDLTERYAAAGASLRVDLRKLASLPISITGDTMSITSDVPGQPDSAHRQLELAWQPRRDLTLTGQVRTLDDKIASQRLGLRARYREVTSLAIDVLRRFDTDWRWDPSLVAADDPTAARRYLDLGPVLPQILVSLRGGTLIAENVDLQARSTLALDLTRAPATPTSYSAAYLELGGAFEVRLRRTLAVGASATGRQNERADPIDGAIADVRLVTQPLAPSAATGERSFTELGGRARLSLGARTFSALIELYGRRTRYARAYGDLTFAVDASDDRIGGRVSIDAWIGRRLRLFASYDASSEIEYSPQITSFKSLRLTMTGVY
jgi:hypothetical protein